MRLTKKQERALRMFSEYVCTDVPYSEMYKEDYESLGDVFDDLPSCVFVRRKKPLFHYREFYLWDKRNKFSRSGVLSCAPFDGCVEFAGNVKQGVMFPVNVEGRKVVSALKLYNLVAETEIDHTFSHIFDRVKSEQEYIVKWEKGLILPPFDKLIKE